MCEGRSWDQDTWVLSEGTGVSCVRAEALGARTPGSHPQLWEGEECGWGPLGGGEGSTHRLVMSTCCPHRMSRIWGVSGARLRVRSPWS